MKKIFSFIFTLPLTIGNLTVSNLIMPKLDKVMEQPVSVKEVDKPAKIAFDSKNPFGIVLRDKNIEVKLSPSEFERDNMAKVALASKKSTKRVSKREVVVRDIVRNAPEPTADEKRKLVQSAAAKYGVPWQILEAVWQVETGKSWDTGRRSYAGATGPMQFMPGTWRKYRVDANGDGKANIASAHDSVYTAARYLAASGASSGKIDRALFAYNHSASYVKMVKRIAKSLGY